MPSLLRNYEYDGLYSDEEWKDLLDEKKITGARKTAENRFREIDSDTYQFMRKRCKNDLFYLNTAILGHDRLSPNLHGHLCSWMERNSEWHFREILLPRGHFKSTVCTIADGIQIVLPDTSSN